MLSTYREKQGEEGFTLIELLVVIIIIGILAAIAIPTFLGQRERARRSAVQSDLRNLAVGMETYFTDFGTYPSDVAEYTAALGAPKSSDNVTLTIVSGSAIEFCLNATIVGLPTADGAGWYFDSDATKQLKAYGTGTGC